MARTISTLAAAEEAAMAYLAGRYPSLEWWRQASLHLGGGWLVEAVAVADQGDEAEDFGGGPEVRALVMVRPGGSVEEVGADSLSRRSAQRGLTNFQVGAPQAS
ncbi:MAG: hypothetical protein M0005_17860 [Actinomycetota bacterium]|jgi:hypothetical protein|nr:hypothetical protein [Actinomycetota bacterium]